MCTKKTMLVVDLICSEEHKKSCGHEALVNGDVVLNALCSRTTDRP